MDYQIDARGLACPQPVIKTKQALEQFPEGNFNVLVDNESSRDNVIRMLANRGYTATSEKEGADIIISVGTSADKVSAEKSLAPEELTCSTASTAGKNTLIYLKSHCMGLGDEKLGAILIRGFLQTLKDIAPLPAGIVCVNSGVFLSAENEDTIAALKELEKMGVNIFSCGTCLDFYHLKDRCAVGKVSNMYEITELLCNADKVVSP